MDDDTRFFRGEARTNESEAVGRARIVDHRKKIKKPGKLG
jgi:hypothetical protein